MVFHLSDGEAATLDVPDQGAKGIEASVKRDGINVKITVPAIGALYEGIWHMNLNMIIGSFTQSGVSFPLSLRPGEKKRNRPQTPVGPFPYSTEEVSFANGNACLKGTLVLPEKYDRSTPVVIMVTGSGLQNRDEEIFEHKPFAVIADALAREGIASLRYDDRGFGESTGDAAGSTTYDLKDDALAGITLLRTRFDKVGILGHSEGGTIALMLAAEGKVDFVISMAAMVISGKETLLAQNEHALRALPFEGKEVTEYLRLLSDCFDALTGGKPLPLEKDYNIPEPLRKNYAQMMPVVKSGYFKAFLSLDVRPVLKQIECPVLALNGTKDTQVDCSLNIGALESGLPEGSMVEAVEGVNHLFQHCKSGETAEYKEIEETISPEVLQKIIGFVKR